MSVSCLFHNHADDEIQVMNEEYIQEHQINRSHVLRQQPWASKSIPPEYLPDPSTNWFPPMLLLGVALTTKQVDQFAREVNIPVDEGDVGHFYELEAYMSAACGLKEPGIRFRICDSSDHSLVLTLVSNYDLRPNKDLSGPFKKLVETVQKVFGPSKEVVWWLDYLMNHDPDNYFVSASPQWQRRTMMQTYPVVETPPRVDRPLGAISILASFVIAVQAKMVAELGLKEAASTHKIRPESCLLGGDCWGTLAEPP